MDFVSIDFETATSYPNSVCSLGMCIVKNNEVVETKEMLIRPDPFEFSDYNILIHGITPEMVEGEPVFGELWDDIRPVLENSIVVAHNASFDIGALRSSLDRFGIEYPNLDYLCTVKLSQKAYPELSSHKLNFMAEALGISFNHHHAGEDAYVCAELLLRIMKDFKLSSLEEIEQKFEIGVGKLYPGCYMPCTKSKKSKARKVVYTKKSAQEELIF